MSTPVERLGCFLAISAHFITLGISLLTIETARRSGWALAGGLAMQQHANRSDDSGVTQFELARIRSRPRSKALSIGMPTMFPHRILGIIAASLVVLLTSVPFTADAQAMDRITDSLADARLRYEDAMDDLRDDVYRVLAAMRQDAAKSKDPAAAFVYADKGLQAFDAAGQLPDHKAYARWERRYAKAADDMKKSYAKAAGAYVSQGNAILANSVTAESEHFCRQWDIVPWQRDLIAEKPETERTLPSGGACSIETGIGGAYRLEVRARRITDEGVFSIEFPFEDGTRLSVPVLVSANGDIRVLLTICNGSVCADLGTPRPIDMNATVSGEDQGIILRSEVGSAICEMVRVKPIAETRPSQMRDKSKTSNQDKQAQPKGDPLPVNASGEGDCVHHANAESTMRARVSVIQRSGDVVALTVVLPSTGESFLVRCELRGTNLTVTNVEQTKAPARKAPFMVTKTIGGTGSLRNGVLNLRWSVRGSSPNLGKNREWVVQLKDVKMK